MHINIGIMTTKNTQTTSPEDVTGGYEAVNTGTDEPKMQKPQFDKEELLRIFDEIIFSGEYEEATLLRGGKLKLVFRARSADDTVAISREIDNGKFQLISTMQETRALLNLSYSLVEYAGKNYRDVSPEDRRKFVGKLPAPVVGAISDALSKFDEKVAAACIEGQENF